MITLVRKSNDFRLYLLIVTAFLAVFLLGGCSSYSEENLTKEDMEPIATLPPLERILPNDPYLFLPLEAVGFQLTFTGEVDPATVEQSVSFEPKLDFTVRRTQPGEIYLEPEGKLQSETVYTLQVKGVKNEATGIPETLEFNYRTEFRGDRQITNPQWSHDGKEIVYIVLPKDSDTAELWKVNVDKGNEQLLAKGLSWPGRACWAPDDSSILFVKRVAQEDKNYSVPEVRLVDREGRGEKVLVFYKDMAGMVDFGPYNVYPWWSPDGQKVALQLDLGGVDSHSDFIRSMAVVDKDGKNLRLIDGQIFVGWKNKDSLMVLKTYQNYNYGRSYRYDLFSADPAGNEPSELLLGAGQVPNFDRASQTPDLNSLVMGQWKSLSTVFGFKNEGTGLLLYDVAQNFLTTLGPYKGYQKHPDLSPTGKRIVFTGNKEGNWDIYLWENGTVKQLTSSPSHELYPVWSPDSEKAAFVSTRGGKEEIWLLELSSGSLKQLTGLDS